MTTPSTLGPKALPNSGCRIGVDSNASSGRSRKHFIKCECGSSGEQFTWCETMAAYLAGSCTRDQGAKPEPDINIARWNSRPVWWGNIRVKLRLRLWIYNSKKKKQLKEMHVYTTHIYTENMMLDQRSRISNGHGTLTHSPPELIVLCISYTTIAEN